MTVIRTSTRTILIGAHLALALSLGTGSRAIGEETSGSTAIEYPPAIEDNSFLIEEAYNQEFRVVQHISNFVYFRTPIRSLGYSITQEWPIGGQRHQLSYTIPYTFQGDQLGNGIGDVLINYRYQLTGHDAPLTVAPRFSLILPTGDENRGLGTGASGVQTNVAMSKRVNAHFVAHGNVGFTLLHGAKGTNALGLAVKDNLWTYNLGGSAIALVTPRLNLMLEALLLFSDRFDHNGVIQNSRETILNPGIRYAINKGTLQIVPGLGVPIDHVTGQTRVGVFFYLSFEHPF